MLDTSVSGLLLGGDSWGERILVKKLLSLLPLVFLSGVELAEDDSDDDSVPVTDAPPPAGEDRLRDDAEDRLRDDDDDGVEGDDDGFPRDDGGVEGDGGSESATASAEAGPGGRNGSLAWFSKCFGLYTVTGTVDCSEDVRRLNPILKHSSGFLSLRNF